MEENTEEEYAMGRGLAPDGGRYTDTLYAWYDPDTDSFLYHTGVNDEFADPFFDTEEDARKFLGQRADTRGKEQYQGLSLQKLRAKKIGEAVEVLTDQSGIEDFIPDGGTHQIDNPHPDRIWFWYDPAADMIVQEEVEPYTVVGLFETEEDADRFVRSYVDSYNLEDISHLEKYSAELSYEGQGPVIGSNRDGDLESIEEFEQADFDNYG